MGNSVLTSLSLSHSLDFTVYRPPLSIPLICPPVGGEAGVWPPSSPDHGGEVSCWLALLSAPRPESDPWWLKRIEMYRGRVPQRPTDLRSTGPDRDRRSMKMALSRSRSPFGPVQFFYSVLDRIKKLNR